MSWDVVIGIETHVQLKTRNKIFSRASINNTSAPNTAVDFVDMDYLELYQFLIQM